ncbi:hypothetical protein IWX48DRAFT_197462 [Phyllosticta citricarpa]
MCKYHVAVYHCGHEVSFARQTCPFPHNMDTDTNNPITSSTPSSSSPSSPHNVPASSPPPTPQPPLTKRYTHLPQRCSPTCPYIRPPAAYLATRAGRDSDGAWLRDEATGRVLGPAARIDPAVSTAPHCCALKMGVGVGVGREGGGGVGEGNMGGKGEVVFVYGVCAVCDWGFERRVGRAWEGGIGGVEDVEAGLEMEGFRRGRFGGMRRS